MDDKLKSSEVQSGIRFGCLVTIEKEGKRNGKDVWKCLCDCGNYKNPDVYSLLAGTSTSCGYSQIGKGKVEMIGRKFGKLTVVAESDRKGKNGNSYYYFTNCDCGTENFEVMGTALRRKKNATLNCKNCAVMKMRKYEQPIKGNRVYKIWDGMKQRCLNPNDRNYPRYGGRGIVICEEWLTDFNNFYYWAMENGYDDSYSIDRINNDGNYEPSNCRWTTMLVQGNNKSVNIYLTYEGKTQSVADWARELNIYYGTLLKRIEYGWDIERALTEPTEFKIEINGVTKTVNEWSKFSGVNKMTIRSRLSKGWQGEDLIRAAREKRDIINE